MNAQSFCWYEITAVIENVDTSLADEVLRWNKKRFVPENGSRVFDEQEARKEFDKPVGSIRNFISTMADRPTYYLKNVTAAVTAIVKP